LSGVTQVQKTALFVVTYSNKKVLVIFSNHFQLAYGGGSVKEKRRKVPLKTTAEAVALFTSGSVDLMLAKFYNIPKHFFRLRRAKNPLKSLGELWGAPPGINNAS